MIEEGQYEQIPVAVYCWLMTFQNWKEFLDENDSFLLSLREDVRKQAEDKKKQDRERQEKEKKRTEQAAAVKQKTTLLFSEFKSTHSPIKIKKPREKFYHSNLYASSEGEGYEERKYQCHAPMFIYGYGTNIGEGCYWADKKPVNY